MLASAYMKPRAQWWWRDALPRLIHCWQRGRYGPPPPLLPHHRMSRRQFATDRRAVADEVDKSAEPRRPKSKRYDLIGNTIPGYLRMLSGYSSHFTLAVEHTREIVTILKQIEAMVQSKATAEDIILVKKQLSPSHLSIISKAARTASQSTLLLSIIDSVRRVNPNLILTRSTEFNLFETHCRAMNIPKMLEQMRSLNDRGFPLRSDTYDKAIWACYKATPIHYRLIIDLYTQVKDQESIRLDQGTLSMVIEAYSHDPILYNEAVHVMDYATKKHGQLDVEMYHSAINSFNKHGQSSIALALLNRMSVHNIKPNALTFISAINVVSKSGDWPNTLSLYQQAQQTIQNLPFGLYRAMVRACELFNEKEMISAVLKDLIAAGYKPDVNIVNILVNATIKSQHFDQSINIIDKMFTQYKIIPHITLFNTLIHYLTINDHWTSVQTVINRMKIYKVQPDATTYYHIIYALDDITTRTTLPLIFTRPKSQTPQQMIHELLLQCIHPISALSVGVLPLQNIGRALHIGHIIVIDSIYAILWLTLRLIKQDIRSYLRQSTNTTPNKPFEFEAKQPLWKFVPGLDHFLMIVLDRGVERVYNFNPNYTGFPKQNSQQTSSSSPSSLSSSSSSDTKDEDSLNDNMTEDSDSSIGVMKPRETRLSQEKGYESIRKLVLDYLHQTFGIVGVCKESAPAVVMIPRIEILRAFAPERLNEPYQLKQTQNETEKTEEMFAL